jgi:hypothetical protein
MYIVRKRVRGKEEKSERFRPQNKRKTSSLSCRESYGVSAETWERKIVIWWGGNKKKRKPQFPTDECKGYRGVTPTPVEDMRMPVLGVRRPETENGRIGDGMGSI